MNQFDLIKRIRTKTLEAVIERSGIKPTEDLKGIKLSVWDVREVIYRECNHIANEIFIEEFET